MAGSKAELLGLVDKALRASTADGEESRCVEVLGVLKRFPVSVGLLRETRAGVTLRPLTKHAAKEVSAAAKGLVVAWKGVLESELGVQKAPKAEEKKPKAEEPPVPKAAEAPPPTAEDKPPPPKPKPAEAAPAKEEDGAKAADDAAIGPFKPTGDSHRDAVVTKLAEFLCMALEDVPEMRGRCGEVAADVERAMVDRYGPVTKEYKSKYRQLSFNLKDPRNPDLRRGVLMQMISAPTLVELSSEQLASDQQRSQNEKIRAEALRECERGIKDEETTDQFQCGRCKQRKTKYFQMQTRSADEPMTTFVTCVNCGNRWKFC